MKLPKHTCVSCAYYCFDKGNTLNDCQIIPDTLRSEIADGNVRYEILKDTACYKGIVSKDIIRNNPSDIKCPKNEWLQFSMGMAPQISYQQEQNFKTRRWAIIGVIISLIVLITTIVFGICNIILDS